MGIGRSVVSLGPLFSSWRLHAKQIKYWSKKNEEDGESLNRDCIRYDLGRRQKKHGRRQKQIGITDLVWDFLSGAETLISSRLVNI